MAEALNGLKRTMMCGEPREEHVVEAHQFLLSH